MILKKILYTTCLCLASWFCSYAQSEREINGMGLLTQKPDKKHYKIAEHNSNELELVFSGLFLFYKAFISSQDNQRCSFTPSCSEYGLIAIKKKGVLKGMMATFDRLSRCNGLSPDKYETDPESGLLIDQCE